MCCVPGANVPLASCAQLQEFNYTFDFNENTSARVGQRTHSGSDALTQRAYGIFGWGSLSKAFIYLVGLLKKRR